MGTKKSPYKTTPGSIECMLWFGVLWCAACAALYPTAKRHFVRDVSCDVVAEHFPKDYWKSRASFREGAQNISAELTELEMGAGVGSGNLTIDVAFIKGSEPDRVLLHIAGTHGVEAFAGVSIQNAFMKKVKTSQDAGKWKGPSVLLVHALNPYGFERLRRWNEDNVDLNRNLLDEAGFASAREREPNARGYVDLDSFINPSSPVAIADFFWPKALYYIVTHGMAALKTAIAPGQYHKADGLFYGGAKLARSHELLTDFLRNHEAVKGAKRVALIDVHTGLGPWAQDTLLVKSAQQRVLLKAAGVLNGADGEEPLADNRIQNTDAEEGENEEGSAAQGYAGTTGFTTHPDMGYVGLFEGASPEQRLAVCQEFGTVHPVQVFRHLRAENAAYHHGGEEDRERPRQALREVFAPRSNCQWQSNILKRGIALIDALCKHLSS